VNGREKLAQQVPLFLASPSRARRHYLGGFRCAVCGQAGADLSDMGFGFGAGYVAPMRILFSRENGQLTRSSW